MRVLFLSLILLSHLLAKETIMVSVPPQKYFVEQIAKDNFIVKTMMDEDSISPSYHPNSQQYIWAENAIAYLTTGLFNEKIWIKTIKITNPNMQVFDTTQNIKIKAGYPYIWLDPLIVRVQARNILNTLIKLDSKNKEFYYNNFLIFINKISRIDYQIRTILKKAKHKYFLIFDPVYYYYAKRYKLNQVEVSGDPFSTERLNILYIISQIDENIASIFIVPKYYFPKKVLNEMLKTQAIVVPYSHLEYDWESNVINLAKLIAYRPIW